MITAREIIFSARFIGFVRYERARRGDVSEETGGPGQGAASREDGRAGMNERAAGMRRVRRARRVRGPGAVGHAFSRNSACSSSNAAAMAAASAGLAARSGSAFISSVASWRAAPISASSASTDSSLRLFFRPA